MYRSIQLLLVMAALIGASPTRAQDAGMPSQDDLASLYPGKTYSPYAGRNFPSNIYWGETHLHTGLSLDAGLFGDTGHRGCVAVLRIPAGTDLQGYRHINGPDDRLEDAPDQRLVLQQCRAGHEVADLLRRAAHVDIDDLRTVVHVEAGRVRHHGGIRTGDLHGYRRSLARVINAALCLAAAPEQRIGRHHFRHGKARALGRLLAAGHRVPAGFCLDTHAILSRQETVGGVDRFKHRSMTGRLPLLTRPPGVA